jgi:hypothetical protein
VNQAGGMISWVDKTIDTRKYTIVSFDVPGNGFNSATIENYRDFIARDCSIFFIRDFAF